MGKTHKKPPQQLNKHPLLKGRSQDSNPWPSFDGLAAKALMQLLESGLGNERAKLGRV